MNSFFKRLFSSILLLGMFYCAIFVKNEFGFYTFALLALFLSFATVFEFCKIMEGAGHPSKRYVAAFSTLAVVFCMLLNQPQFALGIIFLFCSYMWILFLFSKNKNENMSKIFATVTAFFLFAFPFALVVFLYMLGEDQSNKLGRMWILYLILVTKIGDIGAYVIGSLSNKILPGGNHKMIPSISPGKSFEGAVGGFLCSIAMSILLFPLLKVSTSIWEPVILGALFFFGGMAGDLAESSFKRICSVKDSGRTLPGIGGVFDLVDSLLINTVIFWIYFMIKNPVLLKPVNLCFEFQ